MSVSRLLQWVPAFFTWPAWLPKHWVSVRSRVTAPQLLAGSFIALVVLGTLGLRLLPGLYVGDRLSWLDALFTATSAVCVTGLIVVDTATYFTPWGQAYILLLIQLGGLGIITFASLVILALGRKLSLHQEAVSAVGTEVAPEVDFRQLVRSVVVFTFAFEMAGALLLYLFWAPRLGWKDAIGHAAFHSISAFCNAGFSTFSDSLMGFSQSPLTLTLVIVLIVVGGIGFLTMEEVRLWWGAWADPRGYRFSLHSRLVLVTTALLLVSGWLVYTVIEWQNSLAGMPSWARILNGLFMSTTARTAGFNTVDYAQTSESSSFLTILLMSIGGSPGSTAGGVKTTTCAVLVVLALSRLRGLRLAQVWYRSIPEGTVQRGVGLALVAFGLVSVAIFGLTLTEVGVLARSEGQASFLSYMFEAVSAFNTVGLSMGVTGSLTPTGKGLTILLMYLGRVGPLTFASALALHRQREDLRYAYEDVVIG